MKSFIYIFLGGGLGSVLRYLVYVALKSAGTAASFPIATFLVNMGGCFFIGAAYVLSERLSLSLELRQMLTVGLCGGFTTFSAFSFEGLAMLKDGLYGAFLLYVILSILAGIALALLGAWVATKCSCN